MVPEPFRYTGKTKAGTVCGECKEEILGLIEKYKKNISKNRRKIEKNAEKVNYFSALSKPAEEK